MNDLQEKKDLFLRTIVAKPIFEWLAIFLNIVTDTQADCMWSFNDSNLGVDYKVELKLYDSFASMEDILFLAKPRKSKIYETYCIAMEKHFYSTIHELAEKYPLLAYIGYRFCEASRSFKIAAINPHNSVIYSIKKINAEISKEIDVLKNLPSAFNADDIAANVAFLTGKLQENNNILTAELEKELVCQARYEEARHKLESCNLSFFISITAVNDVV